jgi:hypothetical protein
MRECQPDTRRVDEVLEPVEYAIAQGAESFHVNGVFTWTKQSRILRMSGKDGGVRMAVDTLKAVWTPGRPIHRKSRGCRLAPPPGAAARPRSRRPRGGAASSP